MLISRSMRPPFDECKPLFVKIACCEIFGLNPSLKGLPFERIPAIRLAK